MQHQAHLVIFGTHRDSSTTPPRVAGLNSHVFSVIPKVVARGIFNYQELIESSTPRADHKH